MTRPMRTGSSPSQRGQALVEFAFVSLILLLLFGGAFDLGRVWYGAIGLESAAREGALAAASDPTAFVPGSPCDPLTNPIICRVIGEAAGSFVTIAPADVAVTCAPGPCTAKATAGDTVTVSLTGHFELVTPFVALFGGSHLTIHSTATAARLLAPGATP